MSATDNTTDRTVRLSVRVTADTANEVDQFIEQGLSATRQDLLCRALHCYLYHEDEDYDPQTRIAGLIDHLFTTLQRRIEQQCRERRLYHLFQVTLNLATLHHQLLPQVDDNEIFLRELLDVEAQIEAFRQQTQAPIAGDWFRHHPVDYPKKAGTPVASCFCFCFTTS
jgi:metal-responsive CopG/Arc/MetJ family transcriptional regulator